MRFCISKSQAYWKWIFFLSLVFCGCHRITLHQLGEDFAARKSTSELSLWWDFCFIAGPKNVDSTPPLLPAPRTYTRPRVAFLYVPQIWWCTFSSHVENRIHECRSVLQTVVHTPPCWNRLEVLFMLSQTSARNSMQNPGRHELTDRVNG